MTTFTSSKLMALAAMFAAGVSLMATSARANLYTASDSSATADVTFTPDGPNTDITIVLTNTTPAASTGGAVNLLTGVNIEFTPPTALSLDSQTAAQEVSLSGKNPTTATLDSSGPFNPGWQVQDLSPDEKLWFVGFGSGGIPIIGSFDANNQYPNGGSSLVSGPHPLDIYQTATFTLTAAGTVDDSNVSTLTFLFNTDGATTVDGGGGGSGRTPEPASLGILGLGAMSLLTRKRRS